MTNKILQVFEQIAPKPNPENRFRIVEVYWSIDGMRSRISSKTFSTAEAALEAIRKNGDKLE